MSLCGKKKYVCDPQFNSLPRQVVTLQDPGGMGHVIRGRLNLDNEMRRVLMLIKREGGREKERERERERERQTDRQKEKNQSIMRAV